MSPGQVDVRKNRVTLAAALRARRPSRRQPVAVPHFTTPTFLVSKGRGASPLLFCLGNDGYSRPSLRLKLEMR